MTPTPQTDNDLAQLYAEALRAVQLREDFLSVASHELKTPLTALRLQISAIRAQVAAVAPDGRVGPRLARTLELADKDIGRLSLLIGNLFDATALAAGKLQLSFVKLNLGELIQEIATRYSPQLSAAGCAVHLSIDGNIVGRWDRDRMEQVLINLLTNAIKYAPGSPIEVSMRQDTRQVRVCVRDRGPGIPARAQRAIFDRFERACEKGTVGLGLGLYIVKEIIEAHGGSITLQTDVTPGACFTLTLPKKP